MAGQLTKGITLEYGAVATTPTYGTTVTNLQSFPDIGGTKESVEVTTLADDAHMYINGLISYGDSLDFGCLYTKEAFDRDAAVEVEQAYKLSIPNPTSTVGEVSTVTFTGEPSVRINAGSYGEALGYTLSIKPTSRLDFN